MVTVEYKAFTKGFGVIDVSSAQFFKTNSHISFWVGIVMGIQLAYASPNRSGTMNVNGYVAHFGRRPPEGKDGVTLHGRGIADHHGKIIYSSRSFRYVNLTAKPTRVFREDNFSFWLDPTSPQCEIRKGDRVNLGMAVIQIIKLTPPRASKPSLDTPIRGTLTCKPISCYRCNPTRGCAIVQATSELLYRLRDYTTPHEVLRASVDWLLDLYRGDASGGEMQLNLGSPKAIAIRQLEGSESAWQDAEVPVEKNIDGKRAKVRAALERALSSDNLNTGPSFRFSNDKGTIIGMAAGILEETSRNQGISHAGHMIALQYPSKTQATRDDLCVLHHVAAHISDLLGTIGAAKLRWEHKLEYEAGLAVRGLFHDMRGVCKGASQSLNAINPGQPLPNNQLQHIQESLKILAKHIAKGLSAFQVCSTLNREWIDLKKVGELVLQLLFGDYPVLRDTRNWQVTILGQKNRKLPVVPTDAFAVQRILYNLANNAMHALGDRGGYPRVKRVHILLDTTRRHNLPYARIRVADDGPGMGRGALSTIFDARFSTRRDGHGVGAQVVAEQVRRHRGFIEVASEPDKGTVVGILLPCPVKSKKVNLADPSESWLQPYIGPACREAAVNRCELATLRRRDKQIDEWYKRQGSTKR